MPPTPVRVPSQRPLAPSVASVTSVANNKGDHEMIPGAVIRYPDICLTAEENPGKHQLGERLIKGLCAMGKEDGYTTRNIAVRASYLGGLR